MVGGMDSPSIYYDFTRNKSYANFRFYIGGSCLGPSPKGNGRGTFHNYVEYADSLSILEIST